MTIAQRVDTNDTITAPDTAEAPATAQPAVPLRIVVPPPEVTDIAESVLDDELLARWPLPMPHADGDKETRGKVVIVAGSREMPGAAILAAGAALRAGAGKLVVATCGSVAGLIAAAVPEARVVPLAETAAGGIDESAVDAIVQLIDSGDGVLIGPGMQDEHAACKLVKALLPRVRGARVVLDAIAMGVLCSAEEHATLDQATLDEATLDPQHWHLRGSFPVPVILTPHAGEMAHLTGLSKEEVLRAPAVCASSHARKWRAVLTLKGAATFIACPDGSVLHHEGGNIGLAVSGSGDVLAGVIVGLLARGATLRQAAAWGVALHARAGEALASRTGPLGFLAREIADEVPALMARLGEGGIGHS